ncbi:alpha/beta fold hydrolase [Bacillus manliponensis]|uniref:alpha/beta fold hydrolase n=1 Tax=Bacillus manliponensis TaxID=574376 RepID=UPI00351655ED
MKKEEMMLANGKMIKVSGKELYVETYGSPEKQAVLYLHGGPGEMCYDFSYHQAHRLQDSFYLIMIDQRGAGRSEVIHDEENFRLVDIIEDCEELRKILGIDCWSLIGHSFGGFLALLYAKMYPASLHKIIFEGPTFDFEKTARALLKRTAELYEKYGKPELAKECVSMSKQELSPRELVEGYMDIREELGDRTMEIYTYKFHDSTNEDNMCTEEQWDEYWERSEIHYDRLREDGELFQSLLPVIKTVSHPMLLILGDYDVVTCEEQVETFKGEAKNGKIILLEESGHTPHYEVADAFADTVIEFLK